eukprot:3981899-Pyramimonas_sp.AAC.1
MSSGRVAESGHVRRACDREWTQLESGHVRRACGREWTCKVGVWPRVDMSCQAGVWPRVDMSGGRVAESGH